SETKAMVLPSGDQAGEVSECPLPLVSCVVFLPSNETNHSDLVVLSDFSSQDRHVYATQFPSGEGARSSRRRIPSMSLALNGWALAKVEAPGFFRGLANPDCPAGRSEPAQDEGFACSKPEWLRSARTTFESTD